MSDAVPLACEPSLYLEWAKEEAATWPAQLGLLKLYSVSGDLLFVSMFGKLFHADIQYMVLMLEWAVRVLVLQVGA